MAVVTVPKIAFVSCYPPIQGRLSEYASNLINELQKCTGIDHIDIIAETTNGRTVETISEKVTIHRTWKSNSPASLLSILLKIQLLKPDIVHFNVHMAVFGSSRIANFAGLVLPFLSRLMGFRTVTTLHNIVEIIEIEKTGFKNSIVNRLGAFMVTKLIALSSAVTLNMKSHEQILKERYNCKHTRLIPHGTWKNGTVYDSIPSRNESVLYIGHTGPYKDLELLFEAFRIIENKKLGLKLIVAGSSHPDYPGLLEKYKKSMSADNVLFTGYIPERQLHSVFEKTCAVVLPYFTCTGTSGVAHLASSFGTPIVATDLPEFRELEEEGCGLLLSPHKPEAFAARIEEIVRNPALALELRKRNQHFAGSRSWDQVASRFSQLYDEMLEAKKSTSF